jgi:hypothetical protein
MRWGKLYLLMQSSSTHHPVLRKKNQCALSDQGHPGGLPSLLVFEN